MERVENRVIREERNLQRDYSLDYIKAFAIAGVCQIHYMHFANTWFDNFIAMLSVISVPLFFMVNGALLFNHSFEIKKHYKKVCKFFVLCIVWKIITIVSMGGFWNKEVHLSAGLINYLFGYNELEGYEAGHFWYLYALIGIYILFPILKICYDNIIGRKCLLVFTIITAFFSFGLTTFDLIKDMICYYLNINTTISFRVLGSYNLLGQYGWCVVYFVIGGFAYCWINQTLQTSESGGVNKAKSANIKYLIIAFFIAWGMTFGINRFQNIVGQAVCIVIDGYYQVTTLIMASTLFLIFVQWFSMKRHFLFCVIGENTWGIYMLHMITGMIFLKVQQTYWFPLGIVLNSVKVLWMIGSSLIIILILKKIPVFRRLF